MKKKVFVISFIIVILFLGLVVLNYNKESKIKYVFLFIGDGMSSTQVELFEIYNEVINESKELLSFTNFNNIGLRKNKSGSSYVTDSAASATVLASGKLTYNGSINKTINGENLIPITYELHERGMKIGVVTNVPINHATPAAFYGCASSRDDYDTLAYNLADSNFEFFAGDNFMLNEVSSSEINSYLLDKGYTVVNKKQDLEKLENSEKCVVLGDYSFFSLDYANELNLETYVKKGIEFLDNKNGFFMMVESGKIDGALHSNDAKAAIYEVNELDKAVKVAIEFAEKHKDETLIIVTGDHETGGLALGNNNVSYALNLSVLEKQKYSFERLINYSNDIIKNNIAYEDVLAYLNKNYGVDETFDLDKISEAYLSLKEGKNDALYKEVLYQINNKVGIAFTTNNHTADRIPIYADGALSDKFRGVYNSEVFVNLTSELEMNYLEQLVTELKKYNLILQIHCDSSIELNKQIIYLERIEQYAKYLNTKIILTFHSIYDKDKKESINKTKQYIEELIKRINNNKLIVCLENLNNLEEKYRLKKEDLYTVVMNNENIYFTYDIGHEIVEYGDIINIYDDLFSKVKNVHIHTCDEIGNDHFPLYADSYKFEEITKSINLLINNKYQYNIVYEYDLYLCNGNNIEEKIIDYLNSIDYLTENILQQKVN